MTCPCPCFKLMAPPHVRMVANSDTTCDDVRKANVGMADKRRNSLHCEPVRFRACNSFTTALFGDSSTLLLSKGFRISFSSYYQILPLT